MHNFVFSNKKVVSAESVRSCTRSAWWPLVVCH